MTRQLDLNCAPIDLYPVSKVLTNSDMTTAQLVLPSNSFEESILPNMPEELQNRLRDGDKRANIWVVDDENYLEHFLAVVDRENRYSIISWNAIQQSRELREGQEMRFGWINQQLHFIVAPEGAEGDKNYFADNEESDEDPPKKAENNEQDGENAEGECMDGNTDEPVAKKRKTDEGVSGSSPQNAINP